MIPSEVVQAGRYVVLFGPNTRQWWVYDDVNDVYINPPISVLTKIKDEVPTLGGCVRDMDGEEAMLYDILSEEPAWLSDESYWCEVVEP